MMQEDEAWHKEILGVQKDHKTKLFQLPSGGRPDNLHEDPLVVLERDIKFGKAKELPKENVKLVSLDANPAETSETAKKSFGSFSFLGNEDTQKKLVEEFLNRNKKPKEESKVEEIPESKEEHASQVNEKANAESHDNNDNQVDKKVVEELPQTIPVNTKLPIDDNDQSLNEDHADVSHDSHKNDEEAADEAEPVVEDE